MKKGIVIYPPARHVFNALNLTPFDKVKVVILGQDPYHGNGQAHGLSFSVPDRINPPPSLVNIFKEIESDLNVKIQKTNGNLENWAKQGVLLLNAILTVRANNPASHRNLGWEKLTNAVIKALSNKKRAYCFSSLGEVRPRKRKFNRREQTPYPQSSPPFPFSANSGFFGCKHFSKTNDYLIKNRPNAD